MYQDLRSKLALYKSSQANKEAQLPKAPPPPESMVEGLEGAVCYYENMPYFMIENRVPLTHFHGGYRFEQALDMDMGSLRKLCDDMQEGMRIEDFLFLDTETTGLSGGTGTIAFLIGVGYFHKDAFILRQYFMRDYNEEFAVLSSLNQLLENHQGLITFNGKAFDWNILTTRFTCNRLRPSNKKPVHIDLLYPSRCIWKLKLQSCRLSSLEENILGVGRIGDIPGYLIPEIYFKYLENREPAEVKKVIKHNELDILSMVSLLLKIHGMLSEPLIKAQDEYELFGIGRIFEKHGGSEEVVQCYDACAASGHGTIKEAASKRLARVYKKDGEYGKAAQIYESLAAQAKVPNIPVLIDLAKYYEHKEKDFTRALILVERAMDAAFHMGMRDHVYMKDLKIRRERLKRKQAMFKNE